MRSEVLTEEPVECQPLVAALQFMLKVVENGENVISYELVHTIIAWIGVSMSPVLISLPAKEYNSISYLQLV